MNTGASDASASSTGGLPIGDSPNALVNARVWRECAVQAELAGFTSERVDIISRTDNRGGKLAIHTWQAVDYADGLVRVGVQSAIPHPEAGKLLRTLMIAKGLPAPPEVRTLESICITEACE